MDMAYKWVPYLHIPWGKVISQLTSFQTKVIKPKNNLPYSVSDRFRQRLVVSKLFITIRASVYHGDFGRWLLVQRLIPASPEAQQYLLARSFPVCTVYRPHTVSSVSALGANWVRGGDERVRGGHCGWSRLSLIGLLGKPRLRLLNPLSRHTSHRYMPERNALVLLHLQ